MQPILGPGTIEALLAATIHASAERPASVICSRAPVPLAADLAGSDRWTFLHLPVGIPCLTAHCKHPAEGLARHPETPTEAHGWQSLGAAAGDESTGLFICSGPADPKHACGFLNREHNRLFWGHELHLLSKVGAGFG